MTEQEWLASNDSRPMWEFLKRKLSLRKQFLIASARCRGVRHLLPDYSSRRTVELVEGYGDGATDADLGAAVEFLGVLAAVADQMGRRDPPWLIRDIVGNPFRPAPFDPARLTPTLTDLATAAYDECGRPSGELDPALLAALSDALEDAGCTDVAILDHLRSDAPHVRGCWAVDSILGRE